MHKDIQYLQLLSVFHYVIAALIMAVSSIFLLHFGVGLMMILSPSSMGGPPPPPFMGWIFAFLGGGAVLLGWSIGIGLILAERFLSRNTHYIFCLIMAGVVLLFVPLGTVLGVFTFIVLLRPSVKHLFETGELPYDSDQDDEWGPTIDERRFRNG